MKVMIQLTCNQVGHGVLHINVYGFGLKLLTYKESENGSSCIWLLCRRILDG